MSDSNVKKYAIIGIIVTIAVAVPGYFLTTNSITQPGNNNDGIIGDGRITDVDNKGGITVVGDGNILGEQTIKPKAKIVGPKQVTINSIAKFDGDSSTDDGKIDFLWKLDGIDQSTKSFFEYTFTELGSHTIELIVTDEDNQSHNDVQTVNIVDIKVHEIKINKDSGSPECVSMDSCYDPASLTIQKDEIVQWTIIGTDPHTITSGIPNKTDGEFDSGLFRSDRTFEYTFENTGIFEYFCQVHPWAQGTVIVK